MHYLTHVAPLLIRSLTAPVMYTLLPVPMRALPTQDPDLFSAFLQPLGKKLSLHEDDAHRVRKYMARHHTEALTSDGQIAFTLHGNQLMQCDPAAAGQPPQRLYVQFLPQTWTSSGRAPCGAAEAVDVTEEEHWALLEPELDELTTHVPATTVVPERTTILTWIYQHRGVMSFAELAERITGFETVTARKRQLRAMLRGLEKLLLISIVNFTGEVSSDEGDSHDEVIGKNSLVSLTWTGMVWMRRAWAARARLVSTRSIQAVHKLMVDEEDDGNPR